MSRYQIQASAVINAPAKRVYDIIADYREGHPNILPKKYFSSLEIEKGGIGAGTVIRFRMTVMGKSQTFRASITEPEPGRVLAETDIKNDSVTTFTVSPSADGRQSTVTITSELKSHDGLVGVFQRFATKRLLSRIYKEELVTLALMVEKL